MPCTTCGRRGASKEKKKCWFMVCCRERPAWWGALVKVDIPFKYSAQVGRTTEWKEKRLHIWLSGRTTRQSCQSCLDSSRHFPSFVQISTPTLFTHRDFPFLLSTSSKKHQIILCTFADKRIKECPASTLVANTSLRPHRPHLLLAEFFRQEKVQNDLLCGVAR